MVTVAHAELLIGGQSMVANGNLPLGNVWQLTLECGCVEYRRVRYIPVTQTRSDFKGHLRGGWYYRRSPEDALPAPRRVKHNCIQK